MSAESEIQSLLDDLVAATRSKNIDVLMRHYASDVLAFDVVDPLIYKGADALRERAAGWFSSFDGPIQYELRDLSFTTAETVAFCHLLSHVVGHTIDGRNLDMWWRTTYGLREMANRWLITHVHNSVPFDPASGRASLDLQP